jgi:hypothetical protein
MSQSNIDRCLKLAETKPLIDAIRESDLTDEELSNLIDAQIELLGREKWQAGDDRLEACPTKTRMATRGVKDILARLDEMEAEHHKVLNNLVAHIEKQAAAFKAFCEGFDEFIELCHPGSPRHSGERRNPDEPGPRIAVRGDGAGPQRPLSLVGKPDGAA